MRVIVAIWLVASASVIGTGAIATGPIERQRREFSYGES